jgi:hypothetical protein
MAQEEVKLSSKKAKKSDVKKEKTRVDKQEDKKEVKAPVKKSEAKKEIAVGSIVSYKDRKFEVLSISNNFADLSLVDKPHKLFSLSLRKLTLVK